MKQLFLLLISLFSLYHAQTHVPCTECRSANTVSCTDVGDGMGVCSCKPNFYGPYCSFTYFCRATGATGPYRDCSLNASWAVCKVNCSKVSQTRTVACVDPSAPSVVLPDTNCDIVAKTEENYPTSRACSPAIAAAQNTTLSEQEITTNPAYTTDELTLKFCYYSNFTAEEYVRFDLLDSNDAIVMSQPLGGSSSFNAEGKTTLTFSPLTATLYNAATKAATLKIQTVSYDGTERNPITSPFQLHSICDKPTFTCPSNKFACTEPTGSCTACVPGRSGPNCETSACSQCISSTTQNCNTDDALPNAHKCQCRTGFSGDKCQYSIKCLSPLGSYVSCDTEDAWSACTVNCTKATQERKVHCVIHDNSNPTALTLDANCDAEKLASARAMLSKTCTTTAQITQLSILNKTGPVPKLYAREVVTMQFCAYNPDFMQEVHINLLSSQSISQMFLTVLLSNTDSPIQQQVTIPQNAYIADPDGSSTFRIQGLGLPPTFTVSVGSACVVTTCTDKKFQCANNTGMCDACVPGRSGPNCNTSECTTCYEDGTLSCNTDDTLPNPHKCQCKPGYTGDKCQYFWKCAALLDGAVGPCVNDASWGKLCSGSCTNYTQPRNAQCFDAVTNAGAASVHSCTVTTPDLTRPCPNVVISALALNPTLVYAGSNFTANMCVYLPVGEKITLDLVAEGQRAELYVSAAEDSSSEDSSSEVPMSIAAAETPSQVSIGTFTSDTTSFNLTGPTSFPNLVMPLGVQLLDGSGTSNEAVVFAKASGIVLNAFMNVLNTCSDPNFACADRKYICEMSTSRCSACRPGRSGVDCSISNCSNCHAEGVQACSTDDTQADSHICQCKSGYSGTHCQDGWMCKNAGGMFISCTDEAAWSVCDNESCTVDNQHRQPQCINLMSGATSSSCTLVTKPTLTRACTIPRMSFTLSHTANALTSNANFNLTLCYYNPNSATSINIDVVNGSGAVISLFTTSISGNIGNTVYPILMKPAAYIATPTVTPLLKVTSSNQDTVSTDISIVSPCIATPCSDNKFQCTADTGACDICQPGRSGAGCMTSACEQCNPAGVAQTCIEDDTSSLAHKCQCKPGFTDGVTCEPICDSSACQNGGAFSIVNRQCATTCTCTNSWSSTFCDTCLACNPNDIRFKPNGDCSACSCTDNWSGASCQYYGVYVRLTVSTTGNMTTEAFRTTVENYYATQLNMHVVAQTPTTFNLGYSILLQLMHTQNDPPANGVVPSRASLYSAWNVYTTTGNFTGLVATLYGNDTLLSRTARITVDAKIHDPFCTAASDTCQYNPTLIPAPTYVAPGAYTSETTTSKSSKDNTGAIVGGVIGGVAGAAVIGGLLYFFLIKRATSKVAMAPAEAAANTEMETMA